MTAEQRATVLRACGHRATRENRAHAGKLPSDQQWLEARTFYLSGDGSRVLMSSRRKR